MNTFESPVILYVVLILLILILIARILNNQDLIKDNSKDQLTDKANIKNARKYFANKKTFKGLLIVSIISLIIIIICDFTSIDAQLIDYFSYELYDETETNRLLYLFPIYIFIIRQIILEVKIGDFLFKYYKVDEPVLEENLLKILLYKKPSQPTQNQSQENKPKEESK